MTEEIKPKIDEAMQEILRSGFPDEAYSKHPTKTYLTTLKAAYVMERLNNVFGIGRWDMEHEVVNADGNYVLMSGRLIFLDYDVIVPKQYGGHSTTGTGTEPADGYKSAITDLISKSASYLEIGIDMFKGKINPPQSGKNPTQQNSNKKSGADAVQCPNEYLKEEYIDKNWNGKLYPNNTIYFNNTKFFVNDEWAEWFKKHPKFKPQTK